MIGFLSTGRHGVVLIPFGNAGAGMACQKPPICEFDRSLFQH